MRAVRTLARIFGWLLTPFVAWAASFLGASVVAAVAAAIPEPRTGLGLTAAFFVSSLLNFSIWLTWWQTVLLVLSALLLAFAPARPRTA